MRDAPPQPTDPSLSSSGHFPGELLVWLSPAFPVGGFAYSQGLETAVASGSVTNAETLRAWLHAVLRHGSLRNDLILMALILHSENVDELKEIAELAGALHPSAERAKEARDQGRNFRDAYLAAWRPTDAAPSPIDNIDPITLPIAVALAAREHTLHVADTLEAYAIAALSNQLSAAIRLGVVGQFDGQRVLAALFPVLRDVAAIAAASTREDLGSATFGADLASMLHETQTTRLFRS